jgi:hypothetical protein
MRSNTSILRLERFRVSILWTSTIDNFIRWRRIRK